MSRKNALAFRPVVPHFYLLSLALLVTVFSYGQTVTGSVSDDKGKKLSSVTVSVKGTRTATTTDASGNFSVNASSNSVLVFSFVDFIEQQVPVNGRSSVDVTLVAADKSMQEVIVTALGIRKESRKLGYSATSVNTDELVKNRTTNVGESLEGRVAGLNITPPAAGAGASNQIRLRGQVGFSGADNSPLLVINGLPMDHKER